MPPAMMAETASLAWSISSKMASSVRVASG